MIIAPTCLLQQEHRRTEIEFGLLSCNGLESNIDNNLFIWRKNAKKKRRHEVRKQQKLQDWRHSQNLCISGYVQVIILLSQLQKSERRSMQWHSVVYQMTKHKAEDNFYNR